jgi:hypothetical protein
MSGSKPAISQSYYRRRNLMKHVGSYVDLIKNPWTGRKFKRGACLIRVKEKDKYYYIFPLQSDWERKKLVIRDFGGGVGEKETPIKAAMREFHEESLHAFQIYITKEVEMAAQVYTAKDTLYILFDIEVDSLFEQIIDRFRKKRENLRLEYPSGIPKQFNETASVVSISRSDFLGIIERKEDTYKDIFISNTLRNNAGELYTIL